MTIKKSVAKEFEKEATRHIGDRTLRVSMLGWNGKKSVTDSRQVISKSVFPGIYKLLLVRKTMIYIVRRGRPDIVRCVRPEFFKHQFGLNLPALLEKLVREESLEKASASIRDMPSPVSINELIAMIEGSPDSAFA
jgi:hypothetical protein